MVSTLAVRLLDFSMVYSVIMVVSLDHDVTLEFPPI
jgi:hypothetical protein